MTDFSPLIAAFAPRERILPVMLTRQAERYGDRPLFTAGNVTWSYRRAMEIAGQAGGMLMAAGIEIGRAHV